MFTRAVANIIKPHVQGDLMLSEEAISLSLGTSFFVAFGLMQLPLGVLLDRYDPRKVNAGLMLIAAAGAVIFSQADSAGMLALGRALMGLGFAAGMMASLKTYSLWFPVDKLPTINGVQFAIGVLGAISATKPTEWALRVMDWQELTLIFAGMTVVAALVLVTIAPKHISVGSAESLGATLGGLKRIYTDAFFWRVVPWITISMGISQGIGTLYVFSWLMDVGGFSSGTAATILSINASVAVVNFLAMGPASEALVKRGGSPLAVPIVGLTLSMIAMAVLALQWTAVAVPVWLIWTIAIGTNVLMFSAVARAFPVELTGRVYTAINLMGFAVTALSQWGVGRILDFYPGNVQAGYQVAFSVLLGLQCLGAAWYFIATRTGFGAQTMLEKQKARL